MRRKINPKVILDQYKNGKIDRKSLIDILISLIENSDNKDDRIESLEILSEIRLEDQKSFSIFKELLISDEIELIRSRAAKFIINNFPNKWRSIIEWVIKYEISPQIISIFIESFKKDNEKLLGRILIEYFKYILDNKTDEKLEYYIEHLKNLNDKVPFEKFDLEKLIEIYFNFKIINYIDKKNKLLHYLLKEGYVIELALNTKKLSDIKGLEKLKKLEFLGLSGINEIDSLVNVPNLKELVLDNSDNKISKSKGLEKLENLSLLRYIDLHNNKISKKEIKQLNKNLKKITI